MGYFDTLIAPCSHCHGPDQEVQTKVGEGTLQTIYIGGKLIKDKKSFLLVTKQERSHCRIPLVAIVTSGRFMGYTTVSTVYVELPFGNVDEYPVKDMIAISNRKTIPTEDE